MMWFSKSKFIPNLLLS